MRRLGVPPPMATNGPPRNARSLRADSNLGMQNYGEASFALQLKGGLCPEPVLEKLSQRFQLVITSGYFSAYWSELGIRRFNCGVLTDSIFLTLDEESNGWDSALAETPAGKQVPTAGPGSVPQKHAARKRRHAVVTGRGAPPPRSCSRAPSSRNGRAP